MLLNFLMQLICGLLILQGISQQVVQISCSLETFQEVPSLKSSYGNPSRDCTEGEGKGQELCNVEGEAKVVMRLHILYEVWEEVCVSMESRNQDSLSLLFYIT